MDDAEDNDLRQARRSLRNAHSSTRRMLTEIARLSGPAVPVSNAGASFAPIELDLKSNSRGTIFSFGGLSIGAGVVKGEFKGIFEESEYSHVYLKDFEQVWYQHGLPGFSKSRRETFNNLSEAFEDAKRPWIAIGNSAGGFAAMFAASIIPFDWVVAFSPQTYVDRDTFKFFTHTVPSCRRFDPKDPENDLLNVLDHTQGPDIKLIYGARNQVDRPQAERLEFLPYVTPMPLDVASHATAKHLKDKNQLLDVILTPPN